MAITRSDGTRWVDTRGMVIIEPFSLVDRRVTRTLMEAHLAIMGWAPMIALTRSSSEQLPPLGIGSTLDYRTCCYKRFSPNPLTLQTRFVDAWVETAWHQFDNNVFWDCVKKMVAAGWITLP